MKSIVIYYFSGTGNTWWVANMLQQKLKELENEVQCYSIETVLSMLFLLGRGQKT